MSLDRAAYLTERYGFRIGWLPYELHPDTPPEGIPVSAGGAGAELKAAGLPAISVDRLVNSGEALALSVALVDHPRWPALHEALFRAVFVEGADISRRPTLAHLLERLDLPTERLGRWVEEGRPRVASSMERAWSLGIGALPGWHFGRGVVLTGAHPRQVFDRVVGRLGG